MNEQIRYIPTDADRTAVRDRIKLLREKEIAYGTRMPYQLNGNARRYISDLRGLSATFDYVRTNTTSNLILDIGAGNAIGTMQLSYSRYGRGLNFEATGLLLPKNEIQLPYHITSGEELEEVDSESVGGAIARFSVAYSACPEMVVHALDRVLVPSGVFKGSFFHDYDPKPFNDFRFPTFEPFRDAFNALGYDTDHIHEGILVAIKPNHPNHPTMNAKDLINKDLNEHYFKS